MKIQLTIEVSESHLPDLEELASYLVDEVLKQWLKARLERDGFWH